MIHTRVGRSCVALALGGIALAGTPRATFAAGEEAAPSNEALEAIVVTANRREENLQNVPITVSAFSDASLKNMGVSSTDALANAVPGLTFTTGGNYATPFLRGVGTSSTGPEAESSVAVYIDGVYQTEENSDLFHFTNVDRVEVLKGPQGTLFGRNATGGVIQVITKDPQQEPRADIEVGYGNYNTTEASLYATGGITRDLAADISFWSQDQRDGWGRDVATGDPTFTSSSTAVRTKWLWTPGEQTRITLIGSYSTDAGGTGYDWHLFPGSVGLDGKTSALSFYDSQNDYHGGNDRLHAKNLSASLKVEYDFTWARGVSITAFESDNVHDGLDDDATPLPLVNVDIKTAADTFTQEFQLLSPQDSRITWVGGVFFLNDDPQIRLQVAGLGLPPGGVEPVGRESATSYAAYGQASAEVIPDTHLTAGLRYTTQLNHIFGETVLPVGGTSVIPGTAGDQSARFQKVTGRIALDHQFTPEVLAYISYDTGFKSGLFNLNNPTNPAVRPETLDAFELGAKSEWLDHRLRVNGSGFYYQFKDIQVNAISDGTQVFYNGAAAKLYGVDLDSSLAASEHLTFNGGIEAIHGYYSDFKNALSFVPSGGVGNNAVTIDASGNPTVRTPRFSGNLSADYAVPLAQGLLNFNLAYSYTSTFAWDPNDILKQPIVHLVNSTLSWSPGDKRWDLRLWAKNILRERYFVYAGGQSLGDVYSPAAPATFGITLAAHLR